MFKLRSDILDFPPVHLANRDGLLAFGGDLTTARLKTAYKNGIFPWYNQDDEILWWAPDPRMVLYPDEIKISKSMRSFLRKHNYTITENKAFETVIDYCSKVTRKGQDGTWLHPDMKAAYIDLFHNDMAFSVEVWNADGKLVGGLYGVRTNARVLSGESMFHLESNTSKLAFIYLAEQARKNKVEIIDCQLYTDHLAKMGAREIPREKFMKYLED